MPDDIPPAPSESADDDASKAETIRITLPPKPEQATVKRETVRINLPGKPAGAPPPAGVSPKKETTKITIPSSEGAETVAPASAPKPFAPPPPKPPSLGGAPQAPIKPMSGINPPPKPPSLGARPTVPLKPAPARLQGSGTMPSEPMTQKAASPKKETARITLPPEGAKPGMPKATVKMQQTQPLVSRPAPALSQSGITQVPAISAVSTQVEAEPDGAVNILSIAALIIALASCGLVFWAYSAAALS